MALADLQDRFVESIGPVLFRLVWWNYLAPSKRDAFADDLFDAIMVSIVNVYQQDQKTAAPPGAKDFIKPIIKTMIEAHAGSFERQLGTFGDETFEKLTRNLVERRNESEFNRRFADQYDAFTSRIAGLSESLISAVKIINEEFVIWLKTHPDDTKNIHADAFEQLTGEILTSHGFSIQFTGRIKNKSADLIALEKNEGGEVIKYLVECKRYAESEKVDLNIVNAVVGASFRAKLNHAMLVTTSSFTRGAVAAQAELEDFRLDLCDGEKVTAWLADYQFNEMGLWLPPSWQDQWAGSV